MATGTFQARSASPRYTAPMPPRARNSSDLIASAASRLKRPPARVAASLRISGGPGRCGSTHEVAGLVTIQRITGCGCGSVFRGHRRREGSTSYFAMAGVWLQGRVKICFIGGRTSVRAARHRRLRRGIVERGGDLLADERLAAGAETGDVAFERAFRSAEASGESGERVSPPPVMKVRER
jgi:hypothetical protein